MGRAGSFTERETRPWNTAPRADLEALPGVVVLMMPVHFPTTMMSAAAAHIVQLAPCDPAIVVAIDVDLVPEPLHAAFLSLMIHSWAAALVGICSWITAPSLFRIMQCFITGPFHA